MASLGTLAVNIVARTEKFTRGVSEAMSGMGRLRSMAVAAGPAIAAGLAAGAAALVSFSRAEAQAIDRIGKFADSVNVGTEALMGLNHAAELNGVSSKMLETGLRNLEIRSSDAAMGTGEAVGAFEELGISADKLNRLSADEKLLAIADAMQTVENHTDKVRIASDLFGSRNAELVNILRHGSQGLAEMRTEAAALGLALSRDQVAAVEASNDAIAKQEAAWKGVKMQMAAVTAPFFTALYEDLARQISVVTGASERRAEAMEREREAAERVASVTVTAEELRANAIARTNKLMAERLKATQEADRLADEATLAQQNSLLDSLIERRETFGMAEEDKIIHRAQRTNVDPALSALIIKEAKAIKALRLEKEAEAEAESKRQEQAELAKKRSLQPRAELSARVAGSVDTYAASRRNLGGPTAAEKFLAQLESEAQEQTQLLREIAGKDGGGGEIQFFPIDGANA